MHERGYHMVSTVPTDVVIHRDRRQLSYHRHVTLGYRHLAIIIVTAVLIGAAVTTEFMGKPVENINGWKDESADDFIPPDIDVSNNDGPWPGVVWLMSFPNSGTSFTLKMIRHVSQMVAATNYGEENRDNDGNSVPVYTNGTNGPFWIDPLKTSLYEHPSDYVLTKTHCGGRCEKCGPSGYVENPYSFLVQCLSGKRVYGNGHKYEHVTYSSDLVKKAVHLIRNPFDNIVSRFHLQVHSFIKKNDTQKLAKFPSSKEGFRTFCRELDARFAHEEKTSRLIDPKVLEVVKNVPCHGDFLRYVQWHDLAFITTQDSLGIPSHVLHYEDYSTRFNETVSELLDFLHMEWKGHDAEFIAGKEYADYYLPEERQAVKIAMEAMASRRTWSNILHYFE